MHLWFLKDLFLFLTEDAALFRFTKKPATGHILLSITSPPIRLLFEGVNQRLLLIEAHQPTSHERQTSVQPVGEWIHHQGQPISHAVGPNEPGVTLRVIHRL